MINLINTGYYTTVRIYINLTCVRFTCSGGAAHWDRWPNFAVARTIPPATQLYNMMNFIFGRQKQTKHERSWRVKYCSVATRKSNSYIQAIEQCLLFLVSIDTSASHLQQQVNNTAREMTSLISLLISSNPVWKIRQSSPARM